MAGLMEPVGPEGPRTYWIRRAVVIGVVLVVLIAVIALVAALSGGGDDNNTAEPPPASGPSLQPAGTPTPTTSPSASDSSGEPSASGDPSGSDKPSASDKPSGSDKPSASATSDKKSTEPSPTKSSSKPPAKPADCKPADLRTTLTGPRTIEPGKEVTFQAGVINGGSTTCTFTLDPKTYELRVYSGSDKIWTTADCAKWQPKVEATLKPQADVTWKVKWSVQRSKDCTLSDSDLLPGTYAANSLVKDAPPAQLVMKLR